jgi:hypothetical protein
MNKGIIEPLLNFISNTAGEITWIALRRVDRYFCAASQLPRFKLINYRCRLIKYLLCVGSTDYSRRELLNLMKKLLSLIAHRRYRDITIHFPVLSDMSLLPDLVGMIFPTYDISYMVDICCITFTNQSVRGRKVMLKIYPEQRLFIDMVRSFIGIFRHRRIEAFIHSMTEQEKRDIKKMVLDRPLTI